MTTHTTLLRKILAASALLTSCATQQGVDQYLDSATAVTVTVAKHGWIFARERPDLAVHARDYITLTPVQANRNGQRTIYLYCQVWSTIDRVDDAPILTKDVDLALIADDRRVQLPKQAADPRRFGFGQVPVVAPNKAVEVRLLAVDMELLRFIVNANATKIALGTGESAEYFLLWRDARAAVSAFIESISLAE